jgi:tetratricopeptide (TPR) repeat protein
VIHARRLGDQASSDPARVEAEIRRVLDLAERQQAPESLALALLAMAVVHRGRWEQADAARLLARATRLSVGNGLPFVEAEVRATRAVVRQDQGRIGAAQREIALALAALARATGVSGQERAGLRARLQLQLAVIAQNAGRSRQAESRYREIAAGEHVPDGVSLRVSNNLALLLASRGAYDEALAESDRAIALAAVLGPRVAAMARQTHAWIVVREGRLTDGMAEFDEVARTYESAGVPLGEYHIDVADTMSDLRLLPEAIAAARAAVDEFAASGTWLMWVEAQVRLARLQLAVGNRRLASELASEVAARSGAQRRIAWTDRARLVGAQARLDVGEATAADVTVARRAAGRFEQAGDLGDATLAYLLAGRAALATDRPSPARAALAAAGRIAARGPLLLRVRGRLALATAARIDGDGAAVVREARAGLRDLALHRSTLPTMELRALASGHGAELGEIGLAELLRGGTPAQTLRWMEQTRAAAILARLPVIQPEDGAGDRGAVTAMSDAVLAVTRGASVPFVGGLRDERPWAVIPGLAQLGAGLDGRVLVETGLCEGRYVAVVVRGRDARVVDLGPRALVEEPLHALVFALRRLASPRSEAAAEAARVNAEARLRVLRERLVVPLGVTRDDELVVAPVGPLHGVPWSALHEGPVSLAPSATAWLGTAAAAWPRERPETVLVAGPGLTGAQEEVEALAAVHPDARVFGADDSFVVPVSRALATADLAHFACHGVPRADNPMFSSLVLADGPVTIQELHRAGVAPRRLVLASCHSGADVAYAGDEVLGFVSGMLARGTAGVVANIAAVPDVEVVDLMVALHRRLAAGETMARALHAARGEIDTDSPAGFVNWCTFGAHGAA